MLTKLNQWLKTIFNQPNTNDKPVNEVKESKPLSKKDKEYRYRYPIIDKKLNFPIEHYNPEIHNEEFLRSIWNGLTNDVIGWLICDYFQLGWDSDKLYKISDLYLKDTDIGKCINIHYSVDYLSDQETTVETQIKIRSMQEKLNLLFDSFRPFNKIVEQTHNELQRQVYIRYYSKSLDSFRLIKLVRQKVYTYICDRNFYSRYTTVNPQCVQDILNELHRLLKSEFDPLFTTPLLVKPYRLYLDGSDIVLFYVVDIYNEIRVDNYCIRDKIQQCFHRVLNEHPEWFIKE